ncbi:hypothetical protein ACFVT1_32790 [Streptomyces sp. NPDC057963]|uniref:hypothetical protein n=1 Tax=Streptomyces sp. NPDC057963 TaxID=3346290 RepID=UPI0036E94213
MGKAVYAWVQFIECVDHHGGALGELFVQGGGVDSMPHGSAPGHFTHGVGVEGNDHAVGGETESRWFQAVSGDDLVEVVPVEEWPWWKEKAECRTALPAWTAYESGRALVSMGGQVSRPMQATP